MSKLNPQAYHFHLHFPKLGLSSKPIKRSNQLFKDQVQSDETHQKEKIWLDTDWNQGLKIPNWVLNLCLITSNWWYDHHKDFINRPNRLRQFQTNQHIQIDCKIQSLFRQKAARIWGINTKRSTLRLWKAGYSHHGEVQVAYQQ